MQRAADYLDYLDAMMVRALGEPAVPEEQKFAARIAHMILTERPKTINERELYRRPEFLFALRDQELRSEVVKVLDEAAWIRRRAVTGTQGGRPSNIWDVNPQLLVER